MDTVTEAYGYINGYDGRNRVIHKNLDANEQASHVSRVKHHLNGLIQDRVTFNPTIL